MGAIVVRPSQTQASATPTAAATYYDAVTCTAAKAARAALSFSVNPHATYVTSVRGWYLIVTVPTAAKVSAKQAILQSDKLHVSCSCRRSRSASRARGR